MTGIERLRRVAEAQDMRNAWTAMLSHELSDIADQIESEHKNDLVQYHVPWSKVQDVMLDMERHVSGVEGAEDSPVARWARELRYALKSDTSDGRGEQNPSWHDPADAADVNSDAPKVTRDPAEDVSMSAYDLLPADEREAIAWVREHGGLDEVRKLARHETKEEVELVALGKLRCLAGVQEGDAASIADMGESIARRLMPEGMEWPRYEDGGQVHIGDVVSDVEVRSVVFRDNGILLSDCTSVPGWGTWRSYKEPIERPAPKVLAADGEPLEVGQTVHSIGSDIKRIVDHIEYERGGTPNVYYEDGGWDYPDLITHQLPVLDADGEMLLRGETVYNAVDGEEYRVRGFVDGLLDVCVETADGDTMTLCHDVLTHTKPEPADSWERWRSDLESAALGYAQDAYHGLETSIDFDGFVRRAKALAGRSE